MMMAIPTGKTKSTVENKNQEVLVVTFDTVAISETNTSQTRAQNDNTVRSNRTENAMAAQDFNSSRSNREKGNLKTDGSLTGTQAGTNNHADIQNKIADLAIVQRIEISEPLTIVGNVLKTKHDTAKNSISNIR